MSGLSKAQAAIVNAPIPQAMQVLASAGSGKTRVLTQRVRYIIENTKKDGVVALTFTNKAAEDMQERLADLEGVDTRCWIATIHAVAQRIVEHYGHTIGLPSGLHIYERDQDRKAVFLQSLRDDGVDIDVFFNGSDNHAEKKRESRIQNYLDQFSIIKRSLLTEEEFMAQYASEESFWRIFQGYQAALLQSGGLDFDDILVYAHRILREQAWCGQIYRAKYRHLCVDEAQDLNPAQYEFIKALCGDQIKSVMMVGDANQMIYGFNGSSSAFLCQRFVEDFSPISYELKENYRSSKAVIHLANKLRPGSQVETNAALAGLSQIVELADEKTEAEWVCNKIGELIAMNRSNEIEGEISLANMVVIGRNRFVFQALETCLHDRQLPFVLKRGERQVEPSSVFGKVLDLAIRVRLNSKDWVDGKKLCAALKIQAPAKWGGDTILNDLAVLVKISATPNAKTLATLLEAIQELDVAEPNIPKFCEVFNNELQSLRTNSAANDEDELERALQELTDFRKSWTSFKRKGLGDSLSSFRNAIALGQVADDYNPAGLTLSTVHTMKGLEKDIVFLVGMCEGVFPDYRAKKKAELDEELNSAFVAVTRAKRWIYITYPQQRMMPWGSLKAQQASRYIDILQD